MMPQQQHDQTHSYNNTIHMLQCELARLERDYKTLLQEDALRADVCFLSQWLKYYMKGSVEAAQYLEAHGPALLENIHLKLKESAQDIQRMDAESPATARRASGARANQFYRAAQAASDASARLRAVANPKLLTTIAVKENRHAY